MGTSIEIGPKLTLGAIAFLVNAPLLFVLIKTKTPVFHSRMNYLVGNLALADCLTGIAIILYYAPCDAAFQHIMYWTTVDASFITVVVMSVERFIVLSYPLTWPFILTTGRTLFAMSATWIAAFGCGLAAYYVGLAAIFAVTVFFELCICTVLALHLAIFCHLQKRHRNFCEKFSDISESHVSDINQASQSKVTAVLLILVVILIVTVFPYMVTVQILMANKLGFPVPEFKHLNALYNIKDYLYLVHIINFAVNPIVYAWRLRRYRKAFADTFFSLLNSLLLYNSGQRKEAKRRMTNKQL